MSARLTDAALSEFERWASGVEKSPAVHPPAGLFLASNVRALVGEVKRLRALARKVSENIPFGQDSNEERAWGWCVWCGQSDQEREDHKPECLALEIEREAGA